MTVTGRVAALAVALFPFLPVSQAEIIRYSTELGPEVAGATGTGFAAVDYDTVEHTLLVSATWSGLSGTTTVAHIHCCTFAPGTAGVAVTPGTLPGFPVGVQAGTYISILLDLDSTSTFTASFLNNFGGGTAAGAHEALIAAFNDQTAYLNIHTNTFPAGEIRGFLRLPEPATLPLLGVALAGLAFRPRTRA